MTTHSSILTWEIPWAEEPDGLESVGFTESDMTQGLKNERYLTVPSWIIHIKNMSAKIHVALVDLISGKNRVSTLLLLTDYGKFLGRNQ